MSAMMLLSVAAVAVPMAGPLVLVAALATVDLMVVAAAVLLVMAAPRPGTVALDFPPGSEAAVAEAVVPTAALAVVAVPAPLVAEAEAVIAAAAAVLAALAVVVVAAVRSMPALVR